MSDPTLTTNEPPAEPPPAGSSASPLWRIFTSPRSLFESLRARPRFWLPLIVVIVAQIVMAGLIVRSDAVRERAITKMEERGMPPERLEAMERALESPLVIGIQSLSGGVVFVFVLLLAAGLAYFVGNLLLGAQATFKHYFCASVFASVIGLVDHLAITVQTLLKGTTSVMSGLGAFVPGDPNAVVYAIDSLTDPLGLWAWFIQALGIGIFTRKGLGVGILATLPAFLIAV
ncbi:MAG TPA: YIP1 family protein, partial [Candidatus Eisenbacteria bacterium]